MVVLVAVAVRVFQLEDLALLSDFFGGAATAVLFVTPADTPAVKIGSPNTACAGVVESWS